MTELRECPFCGAKAEVWQDTFRTWGLIEHSPECWLVRGLPTCKQELPMVEFETWNRRANPVVVAVADDMLFEVKVDEDLRPCPCCGGDALYVNVSHVGRHSSGEACIDAFGVAVECSDCGLITQGYISRDQACEAWNRRAGE